MASDVRPVSSIVSMYIDCPRVAGSPEELIAVTSVFDGLAGEIGYGNSDVRQVPRRRVVAQRQIRAFFEVVPSRIACLFRFGCLVVDTFFDDDLGFGIFGGLCRFADDRDFSARTIRAGEQAFSFAGETRRFPARSGAVGAR